MRLDDGRRLMPYYVTDEHAALHTSLLMPLPRTHARHSARRRTSSADSRAQLTIYLCLKELNMQESLLPYAGH